MAHTYDAVDKVLFSSRRDGPERVGLRRGVETGREPFGVFAYQRHKPMEQGRVGEFFLKGHRRFGERRRQLERITA